MAWTAEQHRLLGAMGFEPMQRIVPGQRPESAAQTPPMSRASPGLPNPTRARAAPPVASASGSGDARLLQALRQAAGGSDIDALIADLARLRTDPAMKRALWPRLRALRRART